MIILTFIFLILLLIFPKEVSFKVAETLDMCFKSVIPSLFPFMVLSNLILSFKKNENNFFIKLISRIFKISAPSAYALILGLLCGYPIGGKIALELFERKEIEEREKNRVLSLANNAGPGFVISTVGGVFFKDLRVGFIIYISHIFASLTFGILTSFFIKADIIPRKTSLSSHRALITDSIKQSIQGVINITGVICFFSSLIALIELIPFVKSLSLKGLIYGFLEITNGVKYLAGANLSLSLKASLSSFIITFSGLSVYLQLQSFSEKIKTASYFLSKMLCGVFAFIYCYFLI